MFSLQTLSRCVPVSFFTGNKQESTFPVIWASGASVCLTFDKNDFIGRLRPPPLNQCTTLAGCVGSDIPIEGMGHIDWAVTDASGMLHTLKLPALYPPTSKVRLSSVTR